MEQSAPVHLASQTQVPVSVLNVPWLEHCSGQVLFRISQLIPPHPGLQWHSPWWQAPWPEHVGSTQSTEDTQPGWQLCHFATCRFKHIYLPWPLWICNQPKVTFREETLESRMMAIEPQLKFSQPFVSANSDFPPDVQLAALRCILGSFQHRNSIIMLHYRDCETMPN